MANGSSWRPHNTSALGAELTTTQGVGCDEAMEGEEDGAMLEVVDDEVLKP